MLKLTDQGAFNGKVTPVETNSGNTPPAVTIRCYFPCRCTTTDPHAIKHVFKGNAQTAEIVFSGTEKQDTTQMLMVELAGKIGGGQHRVTNMGAGYPNGRQRGNGFHGYALRNRVAFTRFYGIRKRSQCDFSAFNWRAKMIISH